MIENPPLEKNAALTRLRKPRLASLTDDALLRLAQGGDKEAAHCLIVRYFPLIAATARRLTTSPGEAGDLMTEAYLRVFEVLNSCRSVKTLAAWVKRITRNVFIRHCQKSHQPGALSLDYLMETAGDHFAPSDDNDPAGVILQEFHRLERRRRVRKAIASLGREYRDIIVMHYCDRQPYEEIAARSGVPVGTVKSRLFRARAALQRRLGDLYA